MSQRNRNKGYFSSHCLCSPKLGHQFGHPQQIVHRPYKPSRQLRPMDPLESSPPKSPNHLDPARDLLHLLMKSLAQTIPNIPCRSAINHRSSSAFPILSHMRGNLPTPQHHYKPSFVVPLVGSKGFGLNLFPSLPLEHRGGNTVSPGVKTPDQSKHQSAVPPWKLLVLIGEYAMFAYHHPLWNTSQTPGPQSNNVAMQSREQSVGSLIP